MNYSKTEQQMNTILNYQSDQLNKIRRPDMSKVETCISESEELLRSLGYGTELEKVKNTPNVSKEKTIIQVPTWEQLCTEAEQVVGTHCRLESIFTEEELQSNQQFIRQLNKDYNRIHQLDRYDISISAAAGLLAAAVDILLVGIPQKSKNGIKAGSLADFIRAKFDEVFPEDEMEKLAHSKVSKVSFDAQDNRHVPEDKRVVGLSSYYHRLLSLGHDPLLGFLFGVYDILNGTMTTIDKNGRFVSQVMKNYADRKETDIFAALAKQVIHFKSDITTSMGLPVPLMGLFNLLQFGTIGEEEQTIAEIVQGMYFEGYDFIHFCSMSLPVMLTEVIVRIGYAYKRMREGNKIKESIPFSTDRDRHPKLATMLFLAHSGAAAINAGKIYFTKNPMAINYPQWIAFAKYSYMQLKWILLKKPKAREDYILGKIDQELFEAYRQTDAVFDEFSNDHRLLFG